MGASKSFKAPLCAVLIALVSCDVFAADSATEAAIERELLENYLVVNESGQEQSPQLEGLSSDRGCAVGVMVYCDGRKLISAGTVTHVGKHLISAAHVLENSEKYQSYLIASETF